jgi:hypothetical protein
MNMLPTHINVAQARLPATYENAKTALANCASIDECHDWANKAEALASYARQADDDTLRKMADRIQARAVRRCGELLKQHQTGPEGGRPKNGDGTGPVSQRQAGEAAGMSPRQIKTSVRVANVDADEFEREIESETPPTVTKLAEIGKQLRPERQTPEGFREATQAIGTVADFARFCKRQDPAFVAGGVLQSEAHEVREQVAIIDQWLDRFVVSLKG